ncbi:hypothetical protein RFI_33133 [Reticulomyxa filosa]|uniref:Uncharacterized protein n=1 Tax=Reticulomyxa filosa TaxID=46433 RepID=X6LU56_RETFI|nr:hypothetical protein RFI_33133 [Reticulomyxa filosa]|eukprot:ETO04265.1 hypothetical protein RFI_33133 [Reticulomyxa filosa]
MATYNLDEEMDLDMFGNHEDQQVSPSPQRDHSMGSGFVFFFFFFFFCFILLAFANSLNLLYYFTLNDRRQQETPEWEVKLNAILAIVEQTQKGLEEMKEHRPLVESKDTLQEITFPEQKELNENNNYNKTNVAQNDVMSALRELRAIVIENKSDVHNVEALVKSVAEEQKQHTTTQELQELIERIMNNYEQITTRNKEAENEEKVMMSNKMKPVSEETLITDKDISALLQNAVSKQDISKWEALLANQSSNFDQKRNEDSHRAQLTMQAINSLKEETSKKLLKVEENLSRLNQLEETSKKSREGDTRSVQQSLVSITHHMNQAEKGIRDITYVQQSIHVQNYTLT